MNLFEPYLPLLTKALHRIDRWRSTFGNEGEASSLTARREIETVILQLSEKLQGNYPFHHPQYAGQMLKPPHPIAWLAYALTMTINPNNHALDGGPPTSEMEKEVTDRIAAMVGYKQDYLGHLTSAGTIANLEALFIAREIHPGKAIAASANAHYTHRRMSHVLNVPFLEIPVDANGTPDLSFINDNAHAIGTIVVTMGTTGLGEVEPLEKLLNLARRYNIRIHADAAYGGFFKLIAGNLPSSNEWDVLGQADSIVIDPHKHGLQPYGCGSVLYKDASVGVHFKHDSPYTYFTSGELHLGEISLECSRAGASSAALWATLQLLPLTEQGLGSILTKCRTAALKMYDLISSSQKLKAYKKPELDILGYFPSEGNSTSEISKKSKELFDAGMRDQVFHLSLYRISAEAFSKLHPEFEIDSEEVTILRSVFMKPEHDNFVNILFKRIENYL